MLFKRGVSAVVATVLIVMITVAAVGIIWATIIPMVRENLGVGNVCKDVDVSIVTSQGYTCYVPGNITLVQVNKGSSNLQVVGFKFYLSALGNSIDYEKDDVLSSNDYKVFYLNSSEFSEIEGISVVPIVQEGNSKTDCSRIDLKSVPVCSSGSVSIGNGPGQISPAEIIASSRSGSGSSPETETPPCVPDCTCADSIALGKTCMDTNNCGVICLGVKQDGTVNYPFGINNWTELNNLRNNLSASYILMKDLSPTDADYAGIGNIWEPIGDENNDVGFTGTFNGNGNTISGLKVSFPTDPAGKGAGLFSYTFNSYISNLGLVDVDIYGYTHVGALVGKQEGASSILNSYSTGIVKGVNRKVGGLVGTLGGGFINNTYSTVTATGTKDIGGLVGFIENDGSVFNSYSTGSATCTESSCPVGGLVGTSVDRPISNSFATGSVNGVTKGGLIGFFSPIVYSSISNSYWYNRSQGLNCYSGGNVGCTSKTETSYFYTSENEPMKSWDVTIWNLSTGSYPKLKWQD